jgi:saccharopine dehydrogenase (NAD+, L-lysine-forming)
MLLVGATGTMGRLIAEEAARRDLDLVLAGRDADRLAEMARTFRAGQARTMIVDVAASQPLEPVVAGADLVLNTVGPFARLAPPLIDACLRAGIPYIDLANELDAVLALLDRDVEARRRSVTLVTGAGFGVLATETLALLLARAAATPLRSVRVLAAPAVAETSQGVQTTVAETLGHGSARYIDGQLVRLPVGQGATRLESAGDAVQVIPVPAGDLVAARRATGAPDVVAYAPLPAERPLMRAAQEMRSYAWAAGCTDQGAQLEARLRFGEGCRASAVIAVETAVRLLARPQPGAWTPGQLFGPELATACGAVVEAVEQAQPCHA